MGQSCLVVHQKSCEDLPPKCTKRILNGRFYYVQDFGGVHGEGYRNGEHNIYQNPDLPTGWGERLSNGKVVFYNFDSNGKILKSTPDNPMNWACPQCTFSNRPKRQACEMCECPIPADVPKKHYRRRLGWKPSDDIPRRQF